MDIRDLQISPTLFFDSFLSSDSVITDPDAARAGLKVSSTLQLHRIIPVSWAMLLRKLRELSPPMREKG